MSAAKQRVRIAIVGDYKAGHFSHVATDDALSHAADRLEVKIEKAWLPTPSLDGPFAGRMLGEFDGFLCGPGDYASMTGALFAIRFARERYYPFVGT
jgi:CTP synthase (UTP-ammonia lyase)